MKLRNIVLLGVPSLFILVGAGYLWQKTQVTKISVANIGYFKGLSFSPDGKQLAILGSRTNSIYGYVYDVQTRSKVCDLPAPNRNLNGSSFSYTANVMFPEWSPDGSQIAAIYSNNEQGPKIPNRAFGGVKAAGFRPAHVTKIAVWNAQNGHLSRNFYYAPPSEDSWAGPLSFSSDGSKLVTYRSPASVLDATTGTRLQLIKGGMDDAFVCKTNEEWNLIAVNNEYGTRFHVFDDRTKKVVWKPKLDIVEEFEWSGDVLGVIDGPNSRVKHSKTTSRLLLWDTRTRQTIPSPTGYGNISWLRFHPRERNLCFVQSHWLYASKTAKPKLMQELVCWDYEQHREVWRYPLATRVEKLEWSPDGNSLAVVLARADNLYITPMHLLVLDRYGHLRVDKNLNRDQFAWSPDSSQLAYAVEMLSSGGGRIEIIQVAK